ncbi:MAG: hypothetical protein U0O03_05545 [Blautia wexlerae]
MSTMTISKNNATVMNNTAIHKNEISKKAGWLERFKNYMLDNATYFAAASTMMNGNAYVAGQIMKNSRR